MAVDSVINQTFKNFELVIVDDASTDNTKDVVHTIEDQRIQYCQHEQNRGAPAARNTGIKTANGEYIAFIDSDDEWHSRKLECQVRKFEESPSKVGAVYTGFYKQFNNKRELGRIPSKRGDIFENQLMQDWVNPTSTVMVRAECFDTVGDFAVELSARQDYEMWIRISREYEFEYIKEPLVTLHTDGSSRISDDTKKRMEAHKMVLEMIEDDIQSLPLRRRRQAFAIQYYTMGRYLQKQGEFAESKSYLRDSIRYYPFHWKSAIALLFCRFGRDTKSNRFLKIKNLLRRVTGFI